MNSRSVFSALVCSTAIVLVASGCKSAYVAATVSNHTGGAVSLVEVDYPSASFGREAVQENGSFPYRFKILGSGPTSVTWTDAAHHEHKSTGPDLHEGQQGRLTITLTPDGAMWQPELTR